MAPGLAAPSTSMRDIKRTAAVAWSPSTQTQPLMATGTLAGAMDASFSTQAELEVHDLHLDDRNLMEASQKAIINVPSRFNRLAWSSHSATSNEGVIIGGCEDGSVSFWNASDLLNPLNKDNSLIARCEAHHGAVRGLQVNPFQPFLVASGATEGEVWLWDLNNLSQPYSPAAAKSSRLEDVTDLAWNRLVPHILATASNSGHTVVWDLKSRKEVLQLSASNRLSMSAIAWNPENATQIVTATDDDQDPVIYSWDLRNARAPEKTLKGHSKGILSLAWCPKDAELLLSCGKDNKSICWNPKSGTSIADLTFSDNWLFDIQWCPRNPDIFSTASFSGQIDINSFQSIMSGGGRPPNTQKAADPSDFFANATNVNVPRQAPSGHVQIPKWLRRPIGVSFGFGGRLITFSSIKADSRHVIISSISGTRNLINESRKLDGALSGQKLVEYCTEKIPSPIQNLHGQNGDAIFWNLAKVLFESNPQNKLLDLLGFDTKKLEEKIKELTLEEEKTHNTANIPTLSQTSSIPQSPAAPDAFWAPSSGEGDAVEGAQFDFGSIIAQQPPAEIDPQSNDTRQRRFTFQGVPFSLFSSESSEIDKTITRAIILGNFEAAVDLCVKADRLSDALLVAICGGEQLVARTQQLYFQKAQYPYLRVVSGIVKKDITDVVEHADVDNWEEILALICSHSHGASFTDLCNILGSRIEMSIRSNPAMITPALICFMAAGNIAKSAALIIDKYSNNVPNSNSVEYPIWLEQFIEKIRVLEQISGYVAPQQAIPIQVAYPGISSKFLQYSYLMASNGLLDVAVRYLNCVSEDEIMSSDMAILFGDRLTRASKALGLPIRPLPDPFAANKVEVVYQQPQQQKLPQYSTPMQQQKSTMYGQQQQQPFGVAPQSFPQPPPLPMQQFAPPVAPGMPQSQNSSAQSWQRSSFSNQPPVQASFGAPPPPPLQQFAAPPAAPMPPQPQIPTFPPQGQQQPPQPQPMSQYSSFNTPPVPAPIAPPPTSLASQYPPQPVALSSSGLYAQPTGVPANMSAPVNSPSQPQPPTFPSTYGAPAPPQPMITKPLSPPPAPFIPAPSMPSSSMYNQASASYAQPQQPQMATATSPPTLSPQASSRPSIMMPEPPKIVAPTVDSGIHQVKRATGPYNDPPMVTPRAPIAPPAPVTTSPMTPPHSFSPQPIPSSGAVPVPSNQSASSPQATPSTAPPKATSPVGPIDPSQIPGNYQPIYQAFTRLISQCQERALPMQKRIVEDSAKRMQSLFHQLASQEITPPALRLINDMANHIGAGQYDQAFELHTPLMTSYFAETGAWILAAKRLIEVAKTVLR